MKKWFYLFAGWLCWSAVGIMIVSAGRDGCDACLKQSESPGRIVSMAPNLTEILFALGLDERIVGVTIDSNYPAAAVEKPRVGDFWKVDIEAVMASRPDLVFTLGFEQQKNLASRLGRIGYECMPVNIEKIEDMYEAMRQIGSATGSEAQAEELIVQLQDKISEVGVLLEGKEPVKVLWVVQREPLRVAGRDTFVNEIIELAGGENAVGLTVHEYPPVGAEEVITCGAEVIIEPAMVKGDLAAQLESAKGYYGRYENLPAAKEGRIYVIDGDIVSRLGPRLYEAVVTTAQCLRPGLFED
jgi:iron complex transport system substrate-binding protein